MTEQHKSNHVRFLFVAIASIAIVALTTWYVARSDHPGIAPSGQKEWFTVDDGKTWFADDREKVPPFQKDGKTAYGCVVMTSRGDASKWVAYLYRFKQPVQSQPGDARSRSMPAELVRQKAMEVKRPGTGDNGWVSATHARGIEVMTAVANAGSTDVAPVSP